MQGGRQAAPVICGMVDATAIVGPAASGHDVCVVASAEKFVAESSIFTTTSDGETH